MTTTTTSSPLNFFSCWIAAGDHLKNYVDGGIDSWLLDHPYAPFLGHINFTVGNQLFFVRVEDEDELVRGPGTIEGLVYAAKKANGVACILPMRKNPDSEAWEASKRGWGLVDATTRKSVRPKSLVTQGYIEMSPWELQDKAVQAVRQYLESQGTQLMSWHSDPEVDPSIWFIGKSNMSEWVVVRALNSSSDPSLRPDNWAATAHKCAAVSSTGHYAPVLISSADKPSGSQTEEVPLRRGQLLSIRFDGFA